MDISPSCTLNSWHICPCYVSEVFAMGYKIKELLCVSPKLLSAVPGCDVKRRRETFDLLTTLVGATLPPGIIRNGVSRAHQESFRGRPVWVGLSLSGPWLAAIDEVVVVDILRSWTEHGSCAI